jgi:H+-translocating NAD(P) transhydrogenase subunit alpha
MNNSSQLIDSANDLAGKASELAGAAITLAESAMNAPPQASETLREVVVSGVDPFIFSITVFVLACFVGYFVVWKVTPALHTPLMSVTNAISSIIIVGAILAVAGNASGISSELGIAAVFIASINIFGGFIVTQRMLQMFRKK